MIVDNTIKSLNMVRHPRVITEQLAVCDTPHSSTQQQCVLLQEADGTGLTCSLSNEIVKQLESLK